MLEIQINGEWVIWDGTQRIDGILYQPNIGLLWPDAELAAIGLRRAQSGEQS